MPAARDTLAGSDSHSHDTAGPRKAVEGGPVVDIIDIRTDHVDFNIRDAILAQMNPKHGLRSLPTLLLYDEKGLQLFEQITYLNEYYLTNAEIELLTKHSAEIANQVPAGAQVIELGSGNLRKVCLLLEAFEQLGKSIDYYALDLSEAELQRTLANVPEFKHVRCHGLLGTYDDGREWMKQPACSQRPICLLHLGSSIGNFGRDEAFDFLQSFADILKPTDSIIVALDSCNDPNKVYHAYNDKEGVTHDFILNGLTHANKVLERDEFIVDDWKVIGEFVYDEDGGRHQAFLAPKHETTIFGKTVTLNERFKIEQSLKYSQLGANKLWKMSGLEQTKEWRRGNDYGLHMLRKANLPFSKLPNHYAAHTLPTIKDWEGLWQAWDIVTRQMLPDQELQDKPIKLRNACIFYLGHIPTFLDIQLHKSTDAPPTEPASYYSIFERGIDPDVDNPEQCHNHSEIPAEWPPVHEIEAYQGRVRARLLALYDGAKSGLDTIPRNVARAIWIGFEHEAMHLETLLYMMLQSDKTLPPPHTITPDFAALADKAKKARVPNEWFDVPEQRIAIGMDDPEQDQDFKGHFGWDNEKPRRLQKVHSFQAQGRPISNEDYARYLYASNIDKIPASWSITSTTPVNGSNEGTPATTNINGNGDSSANGDSNGNKLENIKHDAESVPHFFINDKAVRTVYGLVPLKYALDWPVMASYDELAGCALWMGGRIPSMEETKSIYEHVEKRKERSMQSKLANNLPAVNAHLVNDGVEETPPSYTSSVDGSYSTSATTAEGEQLFIDLTSANVGFKHWHPEPVTHLGGSLAGQAGMGGVWEWTSSELVRHQGFEPMAMYPGYTADFFDGKHNVVLGGSWATHPRVAGRKSFVNWYQRNYPYAWVGARVVRDLQE